MTAPGITIVNPNPKIAAINLYFDFIYLTLIPHLAAGHKLCLKECRPSANGECCANSRVTALFINKLGETAQREKPAISAVPVARFHQGGGFRPEVIIAPKTALINGFQWDTYAQAVERVLSITRWPDRQMTR